jgi:hypothetical protein
MTVTLAKSAMTVLLVAATALASVPAWALHLEDHDRNVIKTVIKEKGRLAPEVPWQPSLGAVPPPQVVLYDVPPIPEVPAAHGLRYVVKGDDVVLVDPDSLQVVDIIRG